MMACTGRRKRYHRSFHPAAARAPAGGDIKASQRSEANVRLWHLADYFSRVATGLGLMALLAWRKQRNALRES